MSATTIARLVIATTRPVRTKAFPHADDELVLSLRMSPSTGTATDTLNRPSFCCLAIRARGMSGVNSFIERSLSSVSKVSSGSRRRGAADTPRSKRGLIARLENAPIVVPPVEIERRNSDPLKSEK